MIEVNNDVYDDEYFDSLMSKNSSIQKKAESIGLPIKEAKLLIKEAYTLKKLESIIESLSSLKLNVSKQKARSISKAIESIKEAFPNTEIPNTVITAKNTELSENEPVKVKGFEDEKALFVKYVDGPKGEICVVNFPDRNSNHLDLQYFFTKNVEVV